MMGMGCVVMCCDGMGWDGNVELSNQSMLCGLWYKGRKEGKGREKRMRRGEEMRRTIKEKGGHSRKKIVSKLFVFANLIGLSPTITYTPTLPT